MKSIRELATLIDCDPISLNKIFVKHDIYILTEFGIDDGYISHDLCDFITHHFEEQKALAFTLDAILERKSKSVPIQQGSYIYFLLLDNIIVYVGQSENLLNRIGQHICAKKEFDHVSVFPVDRRYLNDIEQFHIHLFNPNLNAVKYDKIDIVGNIIRRY